MAVYYLKGTSNSGDSAGLLGYYYPLYTDPSLINGTYHTHTFEGLSDITFYMPMSGASHARNVAPTGNYGGEAYQEYATYVGDEDGLYSGVPDTPRQVVSLATYTPRQAQTYNKRTSNVESTRVEDLIPIQLRDSSETLIGVLSEYYDYMNSVDQSSNIFNRITAEQDIDETSLGYLDRIQSEVAKTVPESKTFDKVSLYKKIIDYYSIRGSEDSVLVFFRIFFDELVEVFYPKDFLLKASDGEWRSNTNVINFSDHIIVNTPNDTKFSTQRVNDLISFNNSSDTQIATGQITFIEERPLDNIHPIINNHLIELNATESDRFDSNTSGVNPTFQPYSPEKGNDTQAIAQLLNGVQYNDLSGFILDDEQQDGDPGLSNNYIDLGDVYASEEVSHGDEFTMIARIRSDGLVRGSVMKIFHSQGQAYPKHEINLASSKVGSYIYKWGAYGYISQKTKGTTIIQQDTWTTVALRCKRDPNATAAAGGNGYMDVSVNGETWERIWDDSVYGTPTTFDLDHVAVNTRNAIPEADRWSFNANGLSIDANDSTYNGKPLYTGTLEKIGTGTDAYITDGGECTLRFESTETAYLNLGLISNNPNDFRPFDSLPSKLYGVWVLYSDHLSSPTDTNASRMENAAMVMWFDGGDNVEYQKMGTTQTGQGNNVETHLPHKMVPTHLQNRIGDPDDDDFDLLHSYRGHGSYHFGPTNTAAERGPNESGAARADFFGVLKDYNRNLSANPDGLVNGQYVYVHPRDQLRNDRKPFYYKEYKGNGYSGRTTASQGGVNYEPVFNNSDKELTWFTSKRLFDISDAQGAHKHLKVGVHRTHGYFKGDILHASYYNRALTQDELNKAHLYVSGLNNKRWGLRVNVDDDDSLAFLDNITQIPSGLNDSDYTLSEPVSPLKDQFWTYDSNKIGSELSNFSATHSNSEQTSTINWGDGSIPVTAKSGSLVFHTFGPSLSIQGDYNNRKGFLSDQNKIQDSDYWQDYSYEIRSGLQSVEWFNEYKKLVHPSGMKLFAALFVQIVRLNKWTGYTSYREGNPQSESQLSKWLEKLTPPWRRDDVSEDGYHMPFYQPGWLDADNRRLLLFAQALYNAGEDAKTGGGVFDRLIYVILKFIIESNSQTRNQLVLEQQLGSQKFLDVNVRSGDYAFLTANELGNSESVLTPKETHESNALKNVIPWGISGDSGDAGGDDQTYGTAVWATWLKRGLNLENRRTYAIDPFGNTTQIWECFNKDTIKTGGGYSSPSVEIGSTDGSLHVPYRFSVWAKQLGDEGGVYFGFRKRELGEEEGTVRFSSSNTTTDAPFFFNNTLPAVDKWYLLVGYLRPPEVPSVLTLPTYSDAGIYDELGNKVNTDAFSEYVNESDAIGLRNVAFANAPAQALTNTVGGNNITINEEFQINWNGVTGSTLVTDNITENGTYPIDGPNNFPPYYGPLDTGDGLDEKAFEYVINVKENEAVTFNINATTVVGEPRMEIAMWNATGSYWMASTTEFAGVKTITEGNNQLVWGPFAFSNYNEDTVQIRFNIWMDVNDNLILDSYSVRDTGDASETSQNSIAIDEECVLGGVDRTAAGLTGTTDLYFLGVDSDTDPANPVNLWGHTISPLRAGSQASFRVNVTNLDVYEGPVEASLRVIAIDSNGDYQSTFVNTPLTVGMNEIDPIGAAVPLTEDVILQFQLAVGNSTVIDFNEFVVTDSSDTSGFSTKVQFWGPRVDAIDGKEPSIEKLIHPTIEPEILYNYKNRPLAKKVYKLNNFSSYGSGVSEIDVNSITSNDAIYFNQENYNENLKFLDNTKIDSYLEINISDMSNVEESGYVSSTQDSETDDSLGNTGGYTGGNTGNTGGGNTGY